MSKPDYKERMTWGIKIIYRALLDNTLFIYEDFAVCLDSSEGWRREAQNKKRCIQTEELCKFVRVELSERHMELALPHGSIWVLG